MKKNSKNKPCPACGGKMKPGITIVPTAEPGVEDFGAVVTMSAGSGVMRECLKCEACGHSYVPGKVVTPPSDGSSRRYTCIQCGKRKRRTNKGKDLHPVCAECEDINRRAAQ